MKIFKTKNMKNKKPIAVLEQFNEKGRKITYMIEFLGHRDYWGYLPEAYVLFKIYLKEGEAQKKPETWLAELLDFGKYKRHKKMLSRTMIASQVHNI